MKRIPFERALRASTTHRHDYLNTYVDDLGNVIDMDVIRGANIRLGVDPLGGAGVHYWRPIAERYGLNLTVVNEAVDPTFRFMTVDWDGQIRMDPSSPYAMQRLIGMKDRFDLAFACDTDHDRHGIVTKSAGLLPPNHYLSVAISYLFQNRPEWRKDAAVGKTVVSSQMIDRITAKLGRKLYEVPVGFKWFVDGLLDGSLGFAGEESAGASFVRRDGSVWTTDKDGFIPCLLAAEITARMGRDPGEIYRELTREFGEPVYDRVEAPATPEQKEMLGETLGAASPVHRPGRRKNSDHPHPRARQRRFHRRVEGGGGERMVRCASVRDGEYLQNLCGELPRRRSSMPHPGGSAEHREGCFDGDADSPRTARIFSPAIYSCNQPPVNPARRKPIWIGGTLPHQAPEKPRAVILYHHHDRSLVEPIVALGNPTC